MKKYSYLLIDKDPAGPIGQSGDNPIAIFRGDCKEEAVKNIIRIIAKYLAKGDFASIVEIEVLITEDKDAITEIIQNEEGGSIKVNGHCISIQPVALVGNTNVEASEGNREDDRFVVQDIVVNERTGKDKTRIRVSVKDCKNPSYDIDLVTADAYDSPFIYHSPFHLRKGDVFAVDEVTGKETGPYIKVENFGSIFVVHTKEKAGVLSSNGSVMLDCIYDGVYPQRRHIQLIKDGKMGLYSDYGNVLIPCEYDDFQFSEDPRDPVIAIKGPRKGYISIDGTFYPVDEETEDFSDLDPNLTYI